MYMHTSMGVYGCVEKKKKKKKKKEIWSTTISRI